jgi:hypothetical protein
MVDLGREMEGIIVALKSFVLLERAREAFVGVKRLEWTTRGAIRLVGILLWTSPSRDLGRSVVASSVTSRLTRFGEHVGDLRREGIPTMVDTCRLLLAGVVWPAFEGDCFRWLGFSSLVFDGECFNESK